MTFPPFCLLQFRESRFGCPRNARVIFAEELGTMSKNNCYLSQRTCIYGDKVSYPDNLLTQLNARECYLLALDMLLTSRESLLILCLPPYNLNVLTSNIHFGLKLPPASKRLVIFILTEVVLSAHIVKIFIFSSDPIFHAMNLGQNILM